MTTDRLSWSTLTLALLCAACSVSSHPTERARLGEPRGSDALLALIDQPGPLTLESVVSSDWLIPRSGLLNLDHPHAKEAGLEERDEPIQISFHVITHPQRGTFLVDTGVQNALRDAPDEAVLRGLTARAMHSDRLTIRAPLGAWLAEHHVQPAGVLLTHLHADHVMGLPDVPRGTPLYVGPGEQQPRALLNLVVQPLIDGFLAGHGPLRELAFQKDPDQRFQGLLDLFGDGSLWAIHVPGHTPGSVAYLARTTSGPVLLVGDTCHTAWGWENDVEPGTFTDDHQANARSLRQLRELSKQHPQMGIRLGHQPLAAH